LIANKTAEDLADLADSVLAGRTWPALFGARMDRFLKQTVQSLSSHFPVTVKKKRFDPFDILLTPDSRHLPTRRAISEQIYDSSELLHSSAAMCQK